MAQRLAQIALLGFWLGITVFGGVAVAYPLIRQRAESNGWMEGEEVDGLYALAVVLPGPSFLNLWGAVAKRAAGPLGALVGQASLMAPALLLVLLLPLTTRIPFVADRADGALWGAAYATAGVLLGTAADGVRRARGRFTYLVILGAVTGLAAGLHPLVILFTAIALGAIRSVATRERGTRAS